MNIFKKLFSSQCPESQKNKKFQKDDGKIIQKQDYKIAIPRIVNSLTYIRKDFFNNCIQSINSSYKTGNAKPVKNRQLTGEIEYAIIAYQLNGAISFMALRKYIQSSQVGDFLKTLTKQMYDGMPQERMKYYFSRYYCPSSDYHMSNFIAQTSRFCSDVTQYITEESLVTLEISIIYPEAVGLEFDTKVIVADAFNDKKTINELESSMEQEINKKVTAYIESVQKIMKEIENNRK